MDAKTMIGFRADSYYCYFVLVFLLFVGNHSCSCGPADDDPLVDIGERALKVLRALKPLLTNKDFRDRALRQLLVYGFQMAYALQDDRARCFFWLWQQSMFANTAIDVIYPERLQKKVTYVSNDFAPRLASVVKALETVEKPLVEFLELNGRDTAYDTIHTDPSLLLASARTGISGTKTLIDRHLTVTNGSNIFLYMPSNLFINHVGQDCNLIAYVQAKGVGIDWGNVAQSLARSYKSAMARWVSERYDHLKHYNDLFFLIVRISLYAYIKVHVTVFRDYYTRHAGQSQSDASKRLWKILETPVLDFTDAIGMDHDPELHALFHDDFHLSTVGDTIEALDKALLDASKFTEGSIAVNEKEFRLYTNPEKSADWESFSDVIHNNNKAAGQYFDFVNNRICRNVRYAEINMFFDTMQDSIPNIDDSKTAAGMEEQPKMSFELKTNYF